MYDEGAGSPIVVIPGIQGRWEWMKPALDALAKRCRTISYSMQGRTFDELAAEVDAALDAARLQTAAICGVSFGGMVAIRHAAARIERTAALVLVSTPSPWWKPTPTQARYIAKPWKSTPAFVATSWERLGPEIKSACDTWPKRLTFCARHALRIVTAPVAPAHMAERIKLRDEVDLTQDCGRITAPTLIVTGEPGLDRVVPPESTRRYAQLIAGAKCAMIENTGHLGLVTRSERFADIVSEFINANRS